MQMDLEELLTSSQGDSPASRGQSQDLKQGQKMTVTSGQKWLALLKTYNLSGSLAKMSEVLLTNPWACNGHSLIWKASGIKPSHLLFQLRLVAHLTKGIDAGLWRTPDTGAGGTSGLLKQGKTHRQSGHHITIRLQDQVVNPHLWPTPTASDWKNMDTANQTMLAKEIKFWPTPTAQDGKNNGGPSQHERNTKPLNAAVDGTLNCDWTEWLMGYPLGWTNLAQEQPQDKSKEPHG